STGKALGVARYRDVVPYPLFSAEATFRQVCLRRCTCGDAQVAAGKGGIGVGPEDSPRHASLTGENPRLVVPAELTLQKRHTCLGLVCLLVDIDAEIFENGLRLVVEHSVRDITVPVSIAPTCTTVVDPAFCVVVAILITEPSIAKPALV